MKDINFTYFMHYKSLALLQEISATSFIRNITGTLIQENNHSKERIPIGSIKLKMLHLKTAFHHGYDIFEVINQDENLLHFGCQIFDLGCQKFKSDILEFYDYSITKRDVCFIEQLELKPRFRELEFRQKAIRDIYFNHAYTCGLIVALCSHIQGTGITDQQNNPNADLSQKLDFEKSMYKLKAFYKKIGFDHIDGYDDLMFLTPETSKKLPNLNQ